MAESETNRENKERGHLSEIEKEVAKKAARHLTIARRLDRKLDHLLNSQWQRMVEPQEVQLDMLFQIYSKNIN